MIEVVDVPEGHTLEDYAAYTFMAQPIAELRDKAQESVKAFAGRTLWMVSSTRQGGGVAEGLPRVVSLLRQLGIRTEWAVISSREERFFELTKHVHNLLHGEGEARLGDDERTLFERESEASAGELKRHIGPDDLLVVHDPQPLAAGAALKREQGTKALWRCHVGLGEDNEATRAAWAFLEPYAEAYDRALFSLPDYVPSLLADRAGILNPTIDPLSHKNRELTTHKLTGILTAAALATSSHPPLSPPFRAFAERLQSDGAFAPATQPEDLGLLFRPTVTQVSRWDRLKGWEPLLDGFARLKRRALEGRMPGDPGDRDRRRIEFARLVLAGPDPEGVHDDPEAQVVFRALRERWLALPPMVQRDVALLKLPMASIRDNALMVNALQRCSTIVAQNSLREGFGLTATEAMWKGVPVLVGGTAAGLRAQVDDGEEGRVVPDPTDAEAIADLLQSMLGDELACDRFGRNARDRVLRSFVIFTELKAWLEIVAGPGTSPRG